MKLKAGQTLRLNIPGFEAVELLEELGSGGAGHVWKVENLSTPETDYFVLKHIQLDPDLEPEEREDYIQRVRREASVNVDSEYIIQCLKWKEPELDNFVLLFPYFPGQNFNEWIKENRERTWKEKKQIFLKILQAVRALHNARIIHRDLKPKNIFILEHDESPRILDFGIAKFRARESVTDIGTIAGTDAYIAPEAFGWGGIKEVDERCDVYAMGIILYEMIVGRNPWRANGWDFADFARYLQEQTSDGRSRFHNILDIDRKFTFFENKLVPEVIRRSTMFEPVFRLQSIDDMMLALQGRSSFWQKIRKTLLLQHTGDTEEIAQQALVHEREEERRQGRIIRISGRAQRKQITEESGVSKTGRSGFCILGILATLILMVAISVGARYLFTWWTTSRPLQSIPTSTARPKPRPTPTARPKPRPTPSPTRRPTPRPTPLPTPTPVPTPTPLHGLDPNEVEDLNKLLGTSEDPTPAIGPERTETPLDEPEQEIDKEDLEELLRQEN